MRPRKIMLRWWGEFRSGRSEGSIPAVIQVMVLVLLLSHEEVRLLSLELWTLRMSEW